MTKNLLLFLTDLLAMTFHTFTFVSLAAFITVGYIDYASFSMTGINPGLDSIAFATLGSGAGFLVSLISLPIPYKLLMKLAVYLKEKRGWVEIRHPRKIFVLALLTFYSPIILIILYAKLQALQ